METVCSIDSRCVDQISALLTRPSTSQVQDYFDKLLPTRQDRGIIVQQDGQSGKGVYASSDFKEGELLLKDQMLVGMQHSSNKMDCLVCSFCFRFIGSIELQIGRRLYLQELGISQDHHCDIQTTEDYSDTDSSDGGIVGPGECPSGSSKAKIPLPEGNVESLMNGNLKLPHSSEFSLPPIIPCLGRCGEAFYCSTSCAEADWESSHSLLCTGERSSSVRQRALQEFVQHANETNDIFLLAAKAISFIVLKYHKLKAAPLEDKCKGVTASVPDNCDLSLLLEAWKPFSMGHKRRWWDCIALPEDIDVSNEAAFRTQIRELAFQSLQLLKAAIFDLQCEPLFSLEIFGHIIGMFELNNLDLVVASPIEDYFLYIDGLPHPIKEEVERVTRPILDSLGEDYAVCCQGTAFFPIQSCMNHCCRPNARAFKREEDRDGQATIIAYRSISKGEEVTISYVDEDLQFEERQASLADYGFRCRCPKCIEEEPKLQEHQNKL